MKKFVVLLLIAVLAFSVVGCADNSQKEEPAAEGEKAAEETTEGTQEPAEGGEKAEIHIGFVTDIGGIDDKSFNETTWKGIERYAQENSLPAENIKYLQSDTESDYVPNISQLADEQPDLIVAAGFKFFDAITEVAANYPDQKFLLVDSVVEADNVASAVFAEEEGSFLVGIAAGLKAEDAGQKKVGFIGGEDFELIQRFEAGYEQGVHYVNPDIEVVVEYAGSFADPAKGKTIASKLYDAGCYVVYHAAGGTGNGLINEAKDRAQNGQDVWAIGVDTNQYNEGIYEGDKSVVLTSMLKAVGVASHDVAEKVAMGTFSGDTYVFDLSNDGVNIPEENPNLKDEWVKKIMEAKEKVKNGELEVSPVPSRLK